MAKGKKTGGRDWPKGTSGNPNGAPRKEDSLSNLLRKELEKVDPDTGLTAKEVIAIGLVGLAKEGNQAAIDRVLDRTEGKPKQSMDVTSNIQFPAVVGMYPEDYDRSTAKDQNVNQESDEV